MLLVEEVKLFTISFYLAVLFFPSSFLLKIVKFYVCTFVTKLHLFFGVQKLNFFMTILKYDQNFDLTTAAATHTTYNWQICYVTFCEEKILPIQRMLRKCWFVNGPDWIKNRIGSEKLVWHENITFKNWNRYGEIRSKVNVIISFIEKCKPLPTLRSHKTLRFFFSQIRRDLCKFNTSSVIGAIIGQAEKWWFAICIIKVVVAGLLSAGINKNEKYSLDGF